MELSGKGWTTGHLEVSSSLLQNGNNQEGDEIEEGLKWTASDDRLGFYLSAQDIEGAASTGPKDLTPPHSQ